MRKEMYALLKTICFLFLLIPGLSWAAPAREDCSPTASVLSSDFKSSAELISCELELHRTCDKHFEHQFERDYYMRKCGQSTAKPSVLQAALYCDTMFFTALGDSAIGMASTAKDAIVSSYMYLRYSTPQEVARDLKKRSIQVTHSAAVVAQTTACLTNPICVQKLSASFIKDINTPGSESRKVLGLMLSNFINKSIEMSEYDSCLTPEARLARYCAVAFSAGTGGAQLKSILSASKFPLFAESKQLAEIERAGQKIVSKTVAPGTRVLIDDFAHKNLTSTAQNKLWIEVAETGQRPGQFFVDSQNKALKYINDTLKNKALADALTNKHNHMVADALAAFKKKHPKVEVHLYSDYKGMRAAIRGPPGKEEALIKEVSESMYKVDTEFAAFVKAGKYLPANAPKTPVVATGIRRSYDESNILTRFGAGTTWKKVSETWKQTDSLRAGIQNKFGDTSLMTSVAGSTKKILRAEVIEVIRKKPSNQQVAEILSRRHKTHVSEADVRTLRTYFEEVDKFSPGLLLAERTRHRFDMGTGGGMTTDFTGVGSLNNEATQLGLAQGRSVEEAIVNIRTAEKGVTRNLDQLKVKTAQSVRATLQKHGITPNITISGDDMVVIPNKPIPFAVRQELVLNQAKVGVPSSMRTSFFPGGMVNAQARAILATEGEGIEKLLRARLEKVLTQSELKGMLYATDMRGTKPGFGPVHLMMNVPKGISDARVKLIRDQFAAAVSDMSNTIKKSGRPSQFSIAP